MKTQKRLAGGILKCSPKRVKFDTSKLDEIKEAITKKDIRALINEGTIRKIPVKSTSRFNARKTHKQKRKGRRKGHGSRKGKATARTNPKRVWINKIRLQRSLLKHLRDKKLIDKETYYDIYKKSKGGFFRSIKHIKLYINERGSK